MTSTYLYVCFETCSVLQNNIKFSGYTFRLKWILKIYYIFNGNKARTLFKFERQGTR